MTEEIIECYRDIDDLRVIDGVILGDNPEDDNFVQSYGVKAPDAFGKVVVRGDSQAEEVIAWVVPNYQKALRSSLDQYLVSVDEFKAWVSFKKSFVITKTYNGTFLFCSTE